MTCSVRVVEGLVQQPNVAWMKKDDVSMGDLNDLNITTITVIDGSVTNVTNVTVTLDPVLFEHRGVYICYTSVVDVASEYILLLDCELPHFFITNNSNLSLVCVCMMHFQLHFCIVMKDIQLYTFSFLFIVLSILLFDTVPPFTVDISRDYSGTLYAEDPVTLICTITLNSLVDIPVIVTNQWTKNMMNINESSITETIIKTDTNRYTAALDFYSLSANDDGEYKCIVLVVANTTDSYINSNVSNEASTEITVECKCSC